MRFLFFRLVLIIVSTLPIKAAAQLDQEAIMKPVRDLFRAMETNDSTLAASVFTADAMLHTIYTDQAGKVQKRSNPVSVLTSAFVKPKEQRWSEPIWNEKLEVSGELASVWVDYAFYLDTTFSHCGVDAFHLIRTDGQWKIFHLADTRQKEGCNVPDELKAKY